MVVVIVVVVVADIELDRLAREDFLLRAGVGVKLVTSLKGNFSSICNRLGISIKREFMMTYSRQS